MERFGVRILDETDGSGGGSNDGSGPGDGSGGLRENPVDPTKTLDQSLPDLLPEETPVIFHHGFTIGEDQETGWLYKNGSPGMLSLQLTSEGSVLDGVATGKMTVSVHSDADFNPYRDGTFLLPVLTFGITDGTFTDGTDYYTGDNAVEVTKSTISPAPEPKSYMNWGKWEMTIVDPNAIERETATHTVHGLWIATDLAQTDLDDLRSTTGDLILGGDFQGSYAGEAHCLRNGTTLLNGTSDFQVNFREQAFTGQFDFDAGPSMGFAGNVNRDGSVQGYCTGVSGEQVISTKSLIEGALYDQGTVIGTAWNALTDQNSYIGVAGGQGTITPSGTTTAVTGQ